MTLIITHISKHGIVHASDSNLTNGNGENVREGKKTFKIPYLKAGLTVAGNYVVGGKYMDEWMNDFINSQKHLENISIELFSRNLKDRIEKEMKPEQKENGCLIHIAGYAEKNGLYHPEFWFIRNIHSMNPQTGEYKDCRNDFEISEDFWSRDYKKNDILKIGFQDSSSYTRQIYVNGLPSGRIGFNIIREKLDSFFDKMWKDKRWDFRSPKNIEETELLVKNYMQIINTLFLLSDYPGQCIGGEINTIIIEQPENIVDSIK